MGKVRGAWQKVPPEPALQPSTRMAWGCEGLHPQESHGPGTDDSWGKGRHIPGILLLAKHEEGEQMGRRALTGLEFRGASPAVELCL